MNYKVIVDAGHGGIDSGAVSDNLQEKDLTLRAAKYMYNRLKELNIPVKVTREDDEYLPKDLRVERVLSLYNNDPNVILISNHINAGGGEGAEVVYALKNKSTLADLVLENIGEAGQKTRKAYQRRLPENPNKDYYYIIRETGNLEPILVEYGFIDNKEDANKLQNNIENYAEAVIKALTIYLGVPYYSSTTPEEYTVQKGDSLWSIAKKFNTTVAELKKINNLATDTLKIGQKIKITSKDTYVVQKGDTLYSISQKYNIPIETIKELNSLTTNTLSIGQELVLSTKIQQPVNPNTQYLEYTVEKGDSLWKISQKYNATVDDILKINDLKNSTIKIGDKLLIPKNSVDSEKMYIVKKGDTLWSISQSTGVKVEKIKELNKLSSNLLTVGQELKLQ